MLFEFFFDLSFFRYFISILLNPSGDLSRATDSLIGDHFDGKFDNFDGGLLNNEKDFGFVFGCEGILFGALLYANNLSDHVGIIFGVVSLVSDKAALD